MKTSELQRFRFAAALLCTQRAGGTVIGGLTRGQKGIALEINGMADHVHILAKLIQSTAIADVLRDLKANSLGWIHTEFPSLKALVGSLDTLRSRSASRR